jgi:hypothetical protein
MIFVVFPQALIVKLRKVRIARPISRQVEFRQEIIEQIGAHSANFIPTIRHFNGKTRPGRLVGLKTTGPADACLRIRQTDNEMTDLTELGSVNIDQACVLPIR